MTKLEAIAASKQFRKDADELLQRMKDHKNRLVSEPWRPDAEALDKSEFIAQHILSIRALEDCIMRQGMALKYIGTPDPYPDSRNPNSPVIEPTADGLKM